MNKLAFAISVLLGSAVSGYGSTVMSVGPTPEIVNPGDTFTLTVSLSTDANIAGFQFDLSFPTFLSVISVTEDGFVAANSIDPGPTGLFANFFTVDNTNGVVTNLLDSASSGETGTDNLVDVQFQALSPGEDLVTLQNVILTDGNLNSITPDSLNSADVTATPEPSTGLLAGIVGMALLGAGKALGKLTRR